jgi:hypothetical protein
MYLVIEPETKHTTGIDPKTVQSNLPSTQLYNIVLDLGFSILSCNAV